jgi:hypothetical protein
MQTAPALQAALTHCPHALQVDCWTPLHSTAPGVQTGAAAHEQDPHAHAELHDSIP